MPGGVAGHAYANLVASFSRPAVAIFYLLAMAVLSFEAGAAVTYRVDDGASMPYESNVLLRWRELVPSRANDNTVEGALWQSDDARQLDASLRASALRIQPRQPGLLQRDAFPCNFRRADAACRLLLFEKADDGFLRRLLRPQEFFTFLRRPEFEHCASQARTNVPRGRSQSEPRRIR